MQITITALAAAAVALAGSLAATVGGLATGAVGAAPGAPIDPVAGNQGFSVIVEGDARVTSNENEGSLAVGGNLTLAGNYRVGNQGQGGFTFPGDTVATALVVGGQVDFTGSTPGATLQVLSGRYAKIGDLSNATVLNADSNGASVNTRVVATGAGYDSTPHVELTVQQPVPSVGAATGLDFTSLFATYRERSAELAECANTVILYDDNGRPLPDQGSVPAGSNIRIELTPGVTNVLRISAENLANVADLIFDTSPSATAPLLVDVDTAGVDDAFTWAVPNIGLGGEQARYVLWNFATATTITLPASAGASLEGTLYAPRAHLIDENSSNIEGDIVVAQLTHGTADDNGGEFHHFPFAATLDCGATPTPTPTPTTPTPSPTPPGDFTVDKSANRRHIDVGQTLTYTLTATNHGTEPLIGASFTDDLTDVLRHAEIISGPTASTGTVDLESPFLNWTGDLAAGQTAVVTYRIRAVRAGEIRNSVVWPGGSDCLEVWVWGRKHYDRPHQTKPHWHHHHGGPHHRAAPCPWGAHHASGPPSRWMRHHWHKHAPGDHRHRPGLH